MAQVETLKDQKLMTVARIDEEVKTVVDILEKMLAVVGTASMEDKVEIAACISGISKKATTIADQVKDTINQDYGPVDATIHGHRYDAILKQVTTERLDTQKLKEERPVIYRKYCRELISPRIRFEKR